MIPFGEAPLLAYLAARETEYTNIRILLMGRAAGLSPEVIRSRLRRTLRVRRGEHGSNLFHRRHRRLGVPSWASGLWDLDTYPVTSVEEARKTVHDLAKTDCAVIYLTETAGQGYGRTCWTGIRTRSSPPSS